MDDQGVILDFLVESHENLDQLDRDLLALEKEPGARDKLASVFRTIHTIKGTCGFLGFGKLESVAHVGESLLSRLRDGELSMTPPIADGLLAMVDAVREMLSSIEATGLEPVTFGSGGGRPFFPKTNGSNELGDDQAARCSGWCSVSCRRMAAIAPVASCEHRSIVAAPAGEVGQRRSRARSPPLKQAFRCAKMRSSPDRRATCAEPARCGTSTGRSCS
jgi:HPt (histidine-containing phosphotransfer) domain-containing protein